LGFPGEGASNDSRVVDDICWLIIGYYANFGDKDTLLYGDK